MLTLSVVINLPTSMQLDMVKFVFEGAGSYAQMVSRNIQMKMFYVQVNDWIPVNSTYYDRDSNQLTTTFVTQRNDRGVYTNNIKFRIHNLPPKQNKNYALVQKEFLHIIGVRVYGNYMPFYCPTKVTDRLQNIAEWEYIPTFKVCNSVADCVDGSDEIFCDHDGLVAPNKVSKQHQVSLGKLLKEHKHAMDTDHSSANAVSMGLGFRTYPLVMIGMLVAICMQFVH